MSRKGARAAAAGGARRLAEEVLRDVEAGRGSARDLLDAALAGRETDPRDRDLAREIVYGALRRRSTLDHLLAAHSTRRLPSLHPAVLAALRAAAYQLLFLDRVPVPAIVDAAASSARRACGPRDAGFVNALLRALSREVSGREDGEGDDVPRRAVPTGDGRHALLLHERLPDPAKDEALSLAIRFSTPLWLVRRWLARLGPEKARTVLRAGIARPATRLQPLPGRERALRALLVEGDIDFEEDATGLILRGAGAVEELPGYAEGLFVVQDATPSRAVALLDAGPGHRVLEIGAGRGGKTALLAARAASIVAVDPNGTRLALLKETMARLGLTNVTTLASDATEELPDGTFDRVLVDAPCSNTGVLARRVEARWRIREADLQPLSGLGRRLLEAGLSRLAPNGVAIYSVCSLEPEEGPDAVRRALRRFPALTLAAEEPLLPVPGLRDGGYHARIEG